MALVQPEVLQAPGRPDDRRAVGRVGDGAVEHLLDTDLAERRHAIHGLRDVRLKAVQILLEELVLRIRVRSVDVATRRTGLVGTEQQPPGLLTHVIRGVRLAQNAHLRQPFGVALLDLGVRFGDDVLVFDRDHGDIETDHGAGAPREVARRRHHMLAGDIPLVRDHEPLAIRFQSDVGDRRVPIDLGAAIARALGQGLGQVGRLDVAVLRMLDRTDKAPRCCRAARPP